MSQTLDSIVKQNGRKAKQTVSAAAILTDDKAAQEALNNAALAREADLAKFDHFGQDMTNTDSGVLTKNIGLEFAAIKAAGSTVEARDMLSRVYTRYNEAMLAQRVPFTPKKVGKDIPDATVSTFASYGHENVAYRAEALVKLALDERAAMEKRVKEMPKGDAQKEAKKLLSSRSTTMCINAAFVLAKAGAKDAPVTAEQVAAKLNATEPTTPKSPLEAIADRQKESIAAIEKTLATIDGLVASVKAMADEPLFDQSTVSTLSGLLGKFRAKHELVVELNREEIAEKFSAERKAYVKAQLAA